MTSIVRRFDFVDFPFPDQTKRANTLAIALEKAAIKLFHKGENPDRDSIGTSGRTTFVVVDVRDANDGSVRAEAIKAAIGGLIHGTEAPDFIQGEDSEHICRFLFVGAEATLTEVAEKDVVKHDLELAIRALMSIGVAHYIGIPENDQGKPAAEKYDGAVLTLARGEAGVQTQVSLSKGIEQARNTFIECTKFARLIPMFRFLGRKDEMDEPAVFDNEALFWEISALYQLGKRSVSGSSDPVDKLRKIETTLDVEGIPDSSYELDIFGQRRLEKWAEWFGGNAKKVKDALKEATDGNYEISQDLLKCTDLDPVLHIQLATAHFKLERYELLRDIARLLGSDAVMRLRELAPRDEGEDRKILIIDDLYYKSLESESASGKEDTQSNLDLKRLRVAMELINWPLKYVHVMKSEALDRQNTLLRIVPTANGDDIEYRTLEPSSCATHLEGSFNDYLENSTVILVDPEAKFDAAGPARVLHLANIIKERRPRLNWTGEYEGNPESHVPRIIALSRRTSGGYVQQCLNFGASAFCPKTRPYHLLFEMARIILRRGENRHRHDTPLASNFRAFGSLKQHTIDSLQRRDSASLIGRTLSLSGAMEPQLDPGDLAWVKSLPKADLHTHIGTAISLPMITLLAYNTLGHCIASRPNDEQRFRELADHIGDIRNDAAELHRTTSSDSPLACLLKAATRRQNPPGPEPDTSNPMGLGDKLIALLAGDNRFNSSITEVSAILVLALSDYHDFSEGTSIRKRIEAFEGKHLDKKEGVSDFDAALESARAQLGRVLQQTAAQWHGFNTLASVRKTVPSIDDGSPETVLSECVQMVWKKTETVKEAFERTKLFKRSDGVQSLTLDEAVASGSNRWTQKTGATGLQHYLQGTDLLGSAHLQFPENIVLAALDIVTENAEDNVVYSELRCETTGYTREGMSAENATELLCRALDVASLAAARDAETPLVRVNVILAAKRHKTEAEAAASVTLFQRVADRSHRLSINGGESKKNRRFLPRWWRPSGVVGFDISGDEREENEWLSKVLAPLNDMSAAITIHAGESESVESIWKAVYQLHARRIGHGLRLLENGDLLQLFVEAGICVELCPYSNRITNGFIDSAPRLDEFPRLAEYPLREYQKHGLEVTIGTDNRHLHPKGHRTLTSEYLEAARMSGGLTRWEVLQIVKAGFKNAFVSKEERRAMLAAVEERLYEIVSGA